MAFCIVSFIDHVGGTAVHALQPSSLVRSRPVVYAVPKHLRVTKDC